MDGEDPISHFFPGEENVDLYAILSLTESASQDDIKKSYRRLALTHHPDKHVASSESVKNDASTKFQQVGFAYAVLSDDKRRERYDRTGRTDEGFLEQAEGENGWEAYFEAMFEQVTRDKLDEMKLAYQGSNEEKEDLKKAYLSSKGSIASILSHIPHCTHEDEQRFIAILNPLVTSGELRSFPAWDVSVKDEKGRKARKAEGEKEAQEAELLAKDLGVWNEFYGDGKVGERMGKGKSHGKGKSKADEKADEDVLKAVIQRKNKDRDPDDFLDGLLSKYGGGDKPSRGKKRGAEDEKGSKKKARMEPDIDDAEFERLQKEIFGEKSKAGAEKKAKATPTKSKAKKTK